jgi:C_GCAxxG_C_C family probable redox protein
LTEIIAPYHSRTLIASNDELVLRARQRPLFNSLATRDVLMESQFASEVRKSAEGSFASGLLCAESVVLALSKAEGVESDLLPKVATAFCSGMARTCGTCGALTGAIMGVSLALGRSQSSESVQPSYTATQRLIREFEQEFRARDCHVLLGCDLATREGQTIFREKKLAERCVNYTGRAAEIAARIIAEMAHPPLPKDASDKIRHVG